jgi:putative spermidine/putrescine transport system permease protein/spermidine/putrescine transport system permease protein
MRLDRLADFLLGAVTLAVFLALYAPVLVVALASVFDVKQQSIDFNSFGLKWYAKLAENGDILSALANSLGVALAAVVASLLLGAVIALYVNDDRNHGRQFLEILVFLPFLLPPMITGLSLLIFFREVGIDRDLLTVTVGHVAFLLALTYRILLTRLKALPRSLVEASYDLGASGLQTLRHVLLPHLRSALVAAALLACTLSFDETLITSFLVGTGMTLPIRLWAMTRVGFSPEINALVTLILAVTVLLALAGSRRVGLRSSN